MTDKLSPTGLLPCPFCGLAVDYLDIAQTDVMHPSPIGGPNCPLWGRFMGTIEQWNTRTSPAPTGGVVTEALQRVRILLTPLHKMGKDNVDQAISVIDEALAMHSLSASGDVERAATGILHARFSTCDERIAEWREANNSVWKTAMRDARAALTASGNSGAVSDDLRPEVLAFARLMERELRANDHKPGWKNDSLDSLAERVSDEAAELSQAVRKLTRQVVWRDAHTPGERGNGWSRQLPNGQRQVGCGYREMEGEERQAQLAKIISEAADVANMAMMAADVCALLNEGERS